MKIGNVELKAQKIWHGTHKDVPFRVVLWGFNDTDLDKWNYYLYLSECNCVNFDALWLPAKPIRYFPTAPEQIVYDYYPAFGAVDMHGRITYYKKHGELCKRSVEIGCDFVHLVDEFRNWDLRSVVADMEQAIDSLYEKGYLKPLEITQQEVE